MRSLAYTRFELVRTFRNARLMAFSLGFPLVLFFIVATPNRSEHNLSGSGISIPLYFMVGLVAFGAMSALISSGSRIATERTDGWTRQLRITPLRTEGKRGRPAGGSSSLPGRSCSRSPPASPTCATPLASDHKIATRTEINDPQHAQ